MPGVNVIRMNSAQRHRDEKNEEEEEEGEDDDDEMKDSFAENTLEI